MLMLTPTLLGKRMTFFPVALIASTESDNRNLCSRVLLQPEELPNSLES